MSQRKSIRVVVVDDSPRDLTLLCEFLKTQQGIEVVGTASNGVELMNVAEALRPDLVITDLHMPRLSGIECTLRLREMMPQTKFIVFTDVNDPFTESDCVGPGADLYLYKEHMADRVMTAIHALFPFLISSRPNPLPDTCAREGCPSGC